MTDREYWIAAFSARRRQMIENYLAVKPTTNQINMRYWRQTALHYSRLVRGLRRGWL